MTYKVTACWYEVVEVEAEDEDEAIDMAYAELKSEIRQNGTVDEWEVKEVSENENSETRQD